MGSARAKSSPCRYPGADVKAAAFELQGESDQLLIVHVLAGGDHGTGSSARVGAVRVTGSDSSVAGQIDGAYTLEPTGTIGRRCRRERSA